MKEFEPPLCELVMLEENNIIATSSPKEKEETPKSPL